MIFNISEAKIQLSKLVNMAYHGKKVVIAKNNLPLVDLVPHKPEGKRTLGLLSGKLKVPDDVMAEDEEINEMFYVYILLDFRVCFICMSAPTLWRGGWFCLGIAGIDGSGACGLHGKSAGTS